MSIGAIAYIPNFINIRSDIQKLRGGIHKHTRQHGDIMIYFYFFKIRRVG
jgi:hypothetical protein